MISIIIYVADHLGFCNGVDRAVRIVEKELGENPDVYIDGMLIHNTEETQRLKDLGLREFDENVEEGSKLILRTHGTDVNLKEELSEKYEVIDTVCPYVVKVQKLAEQFKEEPLIIFGKKGHPEVISINSHSGNNGIIIENIEELKSFIEESNDEDKEYKIINQTTFKKTRAEEMLKLLDEAEVKYKYIDTICGATRRRSESVIKLAKEMDAVIVLGDKKSSNTTKLYEYAKNYCKNVFFVNSIKEIEVSDLMLYNKIGITAGASVPSWIIKEAIEKMEDMNKNEMMEAIESSFKNIKRGDILTGTVLYVNDEEVTVNIDYRADGIIHKDEVSNDPDVKPSDLFKAGDDIEVYVLNMDDGEGNVLLSHKRVQAFKTWDEVQELYENDEIVDAYVTEVTKGGLKCEVRGLNAFMPASHVSVAFKRDLSVFLDKELASKIIDFDKNKRRIIVSRKVVESEELKEIKEKLYSELEVGDVIEGTVQRLTNFGAFVDIGGVDGLIHISELSWDRVRHPSDVVSPGEEVEVKVLDIDPERDRIALSLKQLKQEPWEIFVENNKVGDQVKGKVVNLLDFGAFVKLESGVDGLLHVSQIAREHVEKPSDRLEIGQEVEVLITDIDEDERKISLSIKEIEVREARKNREDGADEPSEFQQVKEQRRRRKAKPKRQPKPEEPSFGVSLGDLFDLDVDEED